LRITRLARLRPIACLSMGLAAAGMVAALSAPAGAVTAPRSQTVGHAHTAGVRGAGAQHINANLVYHGGPIMKKNFTYAIFWEPSHLQTGAPTSVSPTYNKLIKRYFKDVGGNGLYNANTQYYQIIGGNKTFIKNVSKLAGAWVDTANYPASGCNDPATPGNCLSDSQIQAEVTHAIAVNGWVASPTNMFYVFTSKGEGSCFNNSSVCAFTYYCAYHGAFGSTIYANMPYTGTDLGGCGTPTTPNNDIDADSTINVTSHEQMEAVTDPHLNAWYDPSGAENGDLCAWNFGAMDADGGKANQVWNGHFYILQMEWSNKQSKCVQDGP